MAINNSTSAVLYNDVYLINYNLQHSNHAEVCKAIVKNNNANAGDYFSGIFVSASNNMCGTL